MPQLFSDVLIDRDTKGLVSDFGTMIGETSESSGSYDFLVNPSVNDELLMLGISSGAKISSLLLTNEDIGTDSTFDLGIYAGQRFVDTNASQTIYEKDDVILENAFVDNDVQWNVANFAPVELRWDSSGFAAALNRHCDELWQLAGLASNPDVNLRIGFVVKTVFSVFTGGNILLKASYVDK